MKTYTADQLKKKFKRKYINVYPKHFDYWNEKTNRYQTVYEVRGTSSVVKENFQTVEEILN